MIYAIGDIHGYSALLRNMLDAVLADARDRDIVRPKIVLLGDLIDRGPDSMGVINMLIAPEFAAKFDATILLGNHEAWLISILGGATQNLNAWLHKGGAETIESYGISFGGDSTEKVFKRFRSAIPEKHIEFLNGLKLHSCDGNHIFVHAGMRPGLPLEQQSANDLLWIYEEFLTYTGDFGATVVHGHAITRSRMIEVYQNRISVDTGAFDRNGWLSAVILNEDGAIGSLSVNHDAKIERDRLLQIADTDTIDLPARSR